MFLNVHSEFVFFNAILCQFSKLQWFIKVSLVKSLNQKRHLLQKIGSNFKTFSGGNIPLLLLQEVGYEAKGPQTFLVPSLGCYTTNDYENKIFIIHYYFLGGWQLSASLWSQLQRWAQSVLRLTKNCSQRLRSTRSTFITSYHPGVTRTTR